MRLPDSNADCAKDDAILFPERIETIAGVVVTMREYTFAESLKHHALVNALSDAMTEVAIEGKFNDLDSLRAAFGDNGQILLRLIAIACDQPLAWIEGLGAADGEILFMLWWGVNSDFFLRRVLLSVQLRKVREIGDSDGLTSSPPSRLPGMTPPGSPGTPTVN
jgi:hypothetical protein